MIKKLCLLITALAPYVLLAQNSLDVEPTESYIAPKRHALPVASTYQFTYDVYYDQLIIEYRQRMKDNVRKYKQLAKELEKPQYSEFAYFGHKKKPKKRAVGKRKYCLECEIVH